jgi:hypothetical protein
MEIEPLGLKNVLTHVPTWLLYEYAPFVQLTKNVYDPPYGANVTPSSLFT